MDGDHRERHATPVCRPEHDKQHVSSAALAERQVDRRRTDLVARSERSEHAAGVKAMPAVVAASSSPREQAVPAQQLSRFNAREIQRQKPWRIFSGNFGIFARIFV